MRKLSVMLAGVLVLAVPLVAVAQQPQETDLWTPSVLADDGGDAPEAREIVERMIALLRGTQELSLEARVTYEAVQESGEKLQFDMLQRIAMRRPNEIYWVTLRDDATMDKAWYVNGQFSMVRQPANRWAQIYIPGGISEMVEELVSNYNVDVPFPDLLSRNSRDLWLADDVTSIRYVGEAWVGGHWTDHVAIRKPGIDIQLWVRQDDPILAKMAVVFTANEGMPSYTARFSKWSSTLPDDPALFEFTPPPGAERIDAVPVIER